MITANPNVSLLQVKEVAALLSVSTKSVYRWMESNELAFVRLGRSVRISQAELARFIESHTFGNNSDIGSNKTG